MSEMPEAVPLRSGLRVHSVQIIVRVAFGKGLDLMFEDLTSKGRLVWNI